MTWKVTSSRAEECGHTADVICNKLPVCGHHVLMYVSGLRWPAEETPATGLLTACPDKEEPCCLVKVLELLIFSSTPSCGPPQRSCFKTFYTSPRTGPSDGNHIGQVYIVLSAKKASTGSRNDEHAADIHGKNVHLRNGRHRRMRGTVVLSVRDALGGNSLRIGKGK